MKPSPVPLVVTTLCAAVPFILFCSDGLKCLPRTLIYVAYAGFGTSVAQIFIRCALAFASASGGISDFARRAPVTKIFYAHFIMMFVELTVYASIIYFEATSEECTTDICLVLRVVCIIAITLIAGNVISFFMQYDSTGRVWKDTPGLWCMEINKEATSVNRAKAHYLNARLWNRRLRCLACLRNLCRNTDSSTKNNDQLTVLLVSDIVGQFFMTNMVASDLIAGLVLLRWQTHQWVGCGHRVPMSCILRDTEPYNPHPNSHHLSPGENQGTTVSKPSGQLHAEWLSVNRIYAYSKFACAVYGRLLYMFQHRMAIPALCALCKHISCNTCCCCCCQHSTTSSHRRDADRETDPILQPSDDLNPGCCICEHDTCNYAVFSRVTGVPISDLIYYSFTNLVYFSPFLVAIDETTRSIVIAVRGTLSPEDMIVDMLAEGVRVQEEDLGPAAEDFGAENPDFVVHMGILRTARQLRSAILEMRLVEKARRRRPDYPLVVCGHSLGAGVASVLAVLLRSYYPEVKAYAYSPPLGLMNAQLARFCKPFVCSIVYGYDLVSRLSIATLNDLKWRLMDALVNCKIPKYRLLCRSANLLFLRCCLPCCSWPQIGLDTRLLDEEMQRRLLNPLVYQARVSSYTASSELSARREVGGQGTLSAVSSQLTPSSSPPPASKGLRVDDPVTSQNCTPSHLSSYSRFRPGPRSLVCWLKDSGPLVLKTSAPDTDFCPPYTTHTGNIYTRWSEFSSTSAPTGESSASAPSYEELVSMDGNARFAGVVLHIVETDDCTPVDESNDSLDATSSSPWQPRSPRQRTRRRNPQTPPVAVWSSARQFQTILIHPHMTRDHLPSSLMHALERLHRACLSASPHSRQGSAVPTARLLPNGLSDPAHLVRRIKRTAR
ncbi:hypothetical protein SprV_0501956600 [Sparganum proliferum]